MRQGPNPKRQRGRNNQRRHGGGGGGGGNPRISTFESNGPEVKIRGNAHQVLERYLALARDASAQGDRVTAENYYQHAEHYYRLLSAHAAQQAQQQGGPNGGRPGFPGAGPQPELPAVADQPMSDEDEDDDEYSTEPQQNQNRQGPGSGSNGNGSHSSNQT